MMGCCQLFQHERAERIPWSSGHAWRAGRQSADRPWCLLRPPSRGDAVCPNRALLPQVEIQRELLDILQQQLLTPDTLDRLLKVVNAKLRA